MKHEIFYRATSLKIVAPYTLELEFDDGLQKVINLEPVLFGEMFSPLRDVALFNSVKIDPEVHNCLAERRRL